MNATTAANPRLLRSSNALLFVVCLAQFMVILDVAIVNVALPSMRTGLHFSTTGLQWVVNAYTLLLGALKDLAITIALASPPSVPKNPIIENNQLVVLANAT